MLRVIGPSTISFFQFCVDPRVVKQVLLRVTRVRPEMRFSELLQPFQRNPAARKVEPPQRFHHPDIHRERSLKAVGEKQNAVRNFSPHTRQPHQFSARRRGGKPRHAAQIHLAIANLSRRRA
ncbi:MAG: hypothetical protein DME18_06920 [Verrucomicrobia bacterium]|nr:MAG: hypothetical protein DME18_06920 [Verrucomicrobiota bacterium]